MTSRTQTDSGGWRRVSRNCPCPVCERPDWCLIAADGSAAICARVESPKRCGEAGWLHRLRDAPLEQWDRRIVRSVALSRPVPPRDLANLAAGYRRAVNREHLQALAQSLGLSVEALAALGIGWSAGHRAWSFPMNHGDGCMLGIRLRRPNGFKFSVKGSKEGLFLPAVEAEGQHLLICEGPTDTAALLDMGFTNLAGRPSCTGGIKLLVDVVDQRLPAEVVIVADADEPGQRGANNLAAVLVCYAAAVRVIEPPAGVKDARDWLRSGGTRKAVEQAIEATPAREVAVQSRRVQRG